MTVFSRAGEDVKPYLKQHYATATCEGIRESVQVWNKHAVIKWYQHALYSAFIAHFQSFNIYSYIHVMQRLLSFVKLKNKQGNRDSMYETFMWFVFASESESQRTFMNFIMLWLELFRLRHLLFQEGNLCPCFPSRIKIAYIRIWLSCPW